MTKTWKFIFWSLGLIGLIPVMIIYFFPTIIETEKYGNLPISIATTLYILIWIIVIVMYIFFKKKESSLNKCLWKIAPALSGKSKMFENGLLVAKTGKVDLLKEKDSIEFLAETFSFAFFISIDDVSLNTLSLQSIQNEFKSFQNLIVVPGAYNISVDPIHELLKINFTTYNSAPHEIIIPTLKLLRWHQFVITIEGRMADIYQNGVIIKSFSLPNVINSSPGKPMLYMNSEMHASVAYIQTWAKRLKEKEIADNYRWNTDPQGVPPLPSLLSVSFLKDNIPNFCVGGECMISTNQSTDALKYVDYTYA